MHTPDFYPCGLCGKPTRMTSTKRCDNCWEMEGRMQRNPDVALRILASMFADEWQWVPVKPTDAMAVAAVGASFKYPSAINGVPQWRAMLDAAPRLGEAKS